MVVGFTECVVSARALHIPGRENGGADLMSRGGPLPDEWRLHTEVVKQVWTQFGRAEVDLFANRRNSHCALWFSLARWDNPRGWTHLHTSHGQEICFTPFHRCTLSPPSWRG